MTSFRELIAQYIDIHGNPTGKPLSEQKNVIKADKWDDRTYDRLLINLKKLVEAEKSLSDFTHTSEAMVGAAFFDLSQVDPDRLEQADIRPDHVIDHYVLEMLEAVKDFQVIKANSINDDVAAGFATVDLAPKLEEIFDKLKEDMQNAQDLQNGLETLLSNGQKMNGNGEEEGDGEGKGEGKGEGEEAQSQKDLIEQADRLREKADQLDKSLQDKEFEVQNELKQAIKEVREFQESEQQMSKLWGLDQSNMTIGDAQARIDLSVKFRTERFKKIAELLGPLMQIALTEQERKLKGIPNEIYDIEMGNDLQRVLPTEMLGLFEDEIEDLEYLFYIKLLEGGLSQYEMEGKDTIGRGSLIVAEDGSGSMTYSGRDLMSKALTLALLFIAKRQNREFTGIHFGGVGEHYTVDLRKKDVSLITGTHIEGEQRVNHIAGTSAWAEASLGSSGTDFETPLRIALEKITRDFVEYGQSKADIVFVTDGECGVSDKLIADLIEAKQKMNFKIWSIIIGVDMSSLNEFSDRIIFLDELVDPDEFRQIFGDV